MDSYFVKNHRTGKEERKGRYTLYVRFIDQPPTAAPRTFHMAYKDSEEKVQQWLRRMDDYLHGRRVGRMGPWPGRMVVAFLVRRSGTPYNYTSDMVRKFKDYEGYGHWEWRDVAQTGLNR